MDEEVEPLRLKESKEQALHYMETLVEVARESFLILDADLRVISANPIFYQNFKVVKEETVNKLLYNLGNDQWDIPELRSLLEKILPEKKIVKNYEVRHTFETIGAKTMLLNASQIDSVALIILAIEDVSNRNQLEVQVKQLEKMNNLMVGRELKMVEMKQEIERLRKAKDAK